MIRMVKRAAFAGWILLLVALWCWVAYTAHEARGAGEEAEGIIFGVVIVDSPVARLGMGFFEVLLYSICNQNNGQLMSRPRRGRFSLSPGEHFDTVEIVFVCTLPVGQGVMMPTGASRRAVDRSNPEMGRLGGSDKPDARTASKSKSRPGAARTLRSG